MDNLLSLLLFAAFFILMMRYGCGAHMSHRREHRHHDSSGHPTFGARKDPVCGMEVPEDSGYSEIIGGREFRFCSRRCMDEFDTDRKRYAA
jgi:YHS domain-containing protein